jgi:hypothetical protein
MAALATLCPQAAWGQWEFEARLAPHTPKEALEGHGRSFQNIGEVWLRLPAFRGYRGEIGAFRTGSGKIATFGVEKQLLHGRLLPGAFAWVDSHGVQPAVGVSWARHGRVVLEGHSIIASPKKLLGRADAGLRLRKGLIAGVSTELDPAEHGRAWGLGPHVKKSFKGVEFILGHLWRVEGEETDDHGLFARPPATHGWFVGAKFFFAHPKGEEASSHH